MTAGLVVEGVGLSFGAVRVLDGVDFRAGPGETVALLGTNGAGKSTLLRTISGIFTPDRGSIRFDGDDLTRLGPAGVVRRGIVHMPGGRATFPGLTIAENLRLGAITVPRPDRAARVEEVHGLFPWLGARGQQLAGTLSGGQQQMLGLARALMARPRLLLVDELSLGLAPVVVSELLEVVARLRAGGTSLVLVEQHVDLALSVAERAYFLERGRVRFEGRAPDLRERRDLLRAVLLAGATGPA